MRSTRVRGTLSCRLCMATTFTTLVFLSSIVSLLFVATTSSHTIVNGVWWSEELEGLVPKGFDDNFDANWRGICRNRTIRAFVNDGTCGDNKKLTFDGEIDACSRQRNNFDQIQGDIFSFYLARQLGIGHLPPACLLRPRTTGNQWAGVRAEFAVLRLRPDRPLVATRFVPRLDAATIPVQFREISRRLHPVLEDLRNQTQSELIDLVQWSDLILFDYLTANLDRVVNNLYNRQWNEDMMNSPAHNLGKARKSGLLVFLDNESGLVHGYRLLHKYEVYHRALLDSLCVFRKRTVDNIRRLHRHGNAGALIQSTFEEMEGEVAEILPPFPSKSRKILQKRLAKVHEHVKWCEKLYSISKL